MIYGENSDTCGQARASKWHKLKKKCIICLPPDDDTLDHHCDRTNFITYCLMNYNLQEHPSPIGNGWELINGKCRAVRHTTPPLREQISCIPCYDVDDSSDDDQCECGDSTDSDEN